MLKTAPSGVSQPSSCQGVCQSVLCVSECCTSQSRPVQAQRPCPALSSLPQPSPARSGPRSLAQLPRGPGRVPIVQGASQRSYRAQEPWQCPEMCPGGAHGHIPLQPIGTVPRLKNYISTVSENTWKNSPIRGWGGLSKMSKNVQNVHNWIILITSKFIWFLVIWH